VRRLALVPTLIAALLLPSGAHALGLGEIEIQSALNQRLDAEIPLRGVPAGQGGEIDVSLASEDAFENVGLDRPFALTRLRFAVKERDGGDYYVHVTSQNSIVEPFLSFLVEVDWAGGNLLREYTVLLDPPVFTSEDDSERSSGGTTDTARTSGASDGAGVTGEVERGTQASATDGDDGGDTVSASGSGQTVSGGGEDKPVFLEVEEREERARAQADAERAEASGSGSAGRSAAAPGQYGPVGDGETLWSIASRLRSGDMTVQQMMIALLRYNPDAFGGDNINRLKRGYVLRVPDADRVLEVSAQRALAQVRQQNGVWRELQEGSRSRTSVAASDQGTGDAGAASESATGSGDAELSIVGADEGGASSDEAASATGSSSADESEKLQLAREQLESTRLEKEELESRVNQLEQTVSKMEKLLEVRDERLSALQQELRKLEGRQAEEAASDRVADDETATEVAAADEAEETAADDGEAGTDGESGATSEDDDKTVATADGATGDGGDSATTGTDGGSDGGDTAAAEDGEAASEATASADAAGDDQTQSAEATASAGEESDESYIPDDKRATDADRGFETTRTQEPEETWLDQVNGVIATVTGVVAGVGGGLLGGPAGLGLAAAIVLLGGGLILMRRRREAGAADDLEDFEPIHSDSDLASFDADSSGQFEAPAPGDDDDTGADPVSARSAEDAQSALMEEEFDFSSLDEEAPAESTANRAVDEPARGIDDEEAEKDDTVAEADVYLAYGLHQQAEDLLRLALREQSGNALYHEKLLETLYASGKSEEFIEEAETFRGLVAGPNSRLWQRVLAMGRDIAPRHELFAEGDTEYTAADVQPARPAGTDLELDDADGEIDFGLDDEPESAGGGGTDAHGEPDEDDFSSTMMLDSADFEAVEGDGGLVGPDDDSKRGAGAETGESVDTIGAQEEEDDLEFDLGDLEGLSGDSGAHSPAASAQENATADSDDIEFDLDDGDGLEPADNDSADSARAGAETDDGALDFDLDFDESESPALESAETESTGSPAPDAGTGAESYEDGLDFDFDLEETTADSSASPLASPAANAAGGAESIGGDDEDALEIGDLEIGDLDSVETDSVADARPDAEQPRDAEPAPGGDADASETDAFDLSDLDTGPGEAGDEAPADRASSTGEQPAGDAADDAFDLSDLDAVSGTEGDDDGAFNLDDLAAATDTPEAAESAPAAGAEPEIEDSASQGGPVASGDADSAPDEDDEFDTMLDLARAYIDMGDPESATNALEEVAASGSDKQRSEAQSLLDSAR
jgi:pilus assembly protein FimV